MMPSSDFTVGNTVTTAVTIYKQNGKKFLKLSLAAHLWLMIPIYGWGRYFAIAAWISNLSLQELDGDSRNLKLKHYLSISSLFTFLIVGTLAIVAPLLLSLVILFIFLVVYALIYSAFLVNIFASISLDFSWLNSEMGEGIIGLLIILFTLIFSMAFYTKVFVTDLAFDRSHRRVFSLIKQSYSITSKGIKVFLIICLSIIFVFPAWVISYFAISFSTSSIIQNFLGDQA
ncbi:MAG: hypothetical protein AAFN00_20295, partial [Cyanobacteria bacterium J06558_2]